ncbi:hypothetical protein CH373_08925 [Leptospira perolatii]|uniref:FAD/NAD(P)-binding domain-containing protein n=1 Tax=Leptospira perolatii TaxID=2023191 RepID=A0A2M9ZNF8_9LEPT|nr:FAD-dependent oxidoreductase [Leptospira perolatii]PJZ69619.1 hypothetical protein CH360_10070 [Leptospira perolatii]PJZ73606.1 hypothetical protein CH373_08925 [Leptospira perolatii]
MEKKSVLIAGAGYAGIAAANRLARKGLSIEITMVTDKSEFQEKIRNHQVLAGTKQKTYSVRELLHKSVKLQIARIQEILPSQNQLLLENGERVRFDYLAYTLGMAGPQKDSLTPDYASVAGEADCQRVREYLVKNPNAKITIIGAGLTGIESTTELAATYPGLEITLVDKGSIGKIFSQEGAKYTKDVILRRGTKLLENTKIVSFSKNQVKTEKGQIISHDICLLSNGFYASNIAKKSSLPTNEIGQLYVNEFLEVRSGGNILGAGDCIRPMGGQYNHVRMSCAAAIPMGAYLSERLTYLLGGKSKIGSRPFSLGFVMFCVSLGREEGIIQSVYRDDTPKKAFRKGRPAAFIKELVCKFALNSLRLEKKIDFYQWPSFVPVDTELELTGAEIAQR